MLVTTSRGRSSGGARRLNDSYDETVEAQIAAIPAALDQIDAWIAEGVLNGEQLNAADFQIATTLRLLMAFDDLAPAIEGRPAGAARAAGRCPSRRAASGRSSRRSGSRRCGRRSPHLDSLVDRLKEFAGRRKTPRRWPTVELERTLVKSPPELWDELASEPGAQPLARARCASSTTEPPTASSGTATARAA